MSLVDENTKWRTYDGKEIKLKHLSDQHLINVIRHVTKVQKIHLREDLLDVLRSIATSRGISEDMINAEDQTPHLNDKGELEIWDYEKNAPIIVG